VDLFEKGAVKAMQRLLGMRRLRKFTRRAALAPLILGALLTGVQSARADGPVPLAPVPWQFATDNWTWSIYTSWVSFNADMTIGYDGNQVYVYTYTGTNQSTQGIIVRWNSCSP
jgi:hypothetical protein